MTHHLLLAALLFVGCAARVTTEPQAAPAPVPEWEDVVWRLQRYLDESGEMAAVASETVVDARFSRGQVDGSAGCNRYFGSYSAAGEDHLSIDSGIGSTEMACAAGVARQEQRYLSLLPRVASRERREDSLTLFGDTHQALLQYSAVRPAPLSGSAWLATGINNGRGGVVANANTHRSTLSFADGEVTGDAGCNSFSASYEIRGDQIRIGAIATTRMHCAEPDGIMEQEQQYLGALARSRTHSSGIDRLELRDENGALQVGFRARQD